MADKWVSSSPMSNARVKELVSKFNQVFPRSYRTGSLTGGDHDLSGGVSWEIVQAWTPHAAMTLKLSPDATAWIVKRTEGDVRKITEMLAREGLTLER